MKYLKTGFTIIIGSCTIIFTMVAEVGAFKKLKLVPPVDGCFRWVTILCPGNSNPQQLLPDMPCQQPPPLGNPIICAGNIVTNVTLKVLAPTPLGNCPTASIVCCYQVIPQILPSTGFIVSGFVCGNYTPARK